MPAIHLPSYALNQKHRETDTAFEIEGLIDEAIAFFTAVTKRHGVAGTNDAFNTMRERYPQLAITGNVLLTQTLALVLLRDIAPAHRFLAKGFIQVDPLAFQLKAFSKLYPVDLPLQLANKGQASLDTFCRIYGISSQELALKVVLDDNHDAAQAFSGEDDIDTLVYALACTTYNPESKIRKCLGLTERAISDSEFDHRFQRQLDALRAESTTRLADPSRPSSLQPGHRLSHEMIKSASHDLHKLPGYLSYLARYHEKLLNRFGETCLESRRPNAPQLAVTKALLDHFDEAGIPRVDILMMGVYNYSTLSKESYAKTADDFKRYLYHEMLIEDGADYAEDVNVWFSQPRLLQITHMAKKEPVEILESLCKHPDHWHFLYRVTNDKKYLPKLKTVMDKVLSEDLGL